MFTFEKCEEEEEVEVREILEAWEMFREPKLRLFHWRVVLVFVILVLCEVAFMLFAGRLKFPR